MAGKKGKSGRLSRRDEIKVSQLAEKAIGWGIRAFDKMSSADKMKVLLVLAPKYIYEPKEENNVTYVTNIINSVVNREAATFGESERRAISDRVRSIEENLSRRSPDNAS